MITNNATPPKTLKQEYFNPNNKKENTHHSSISIEDQINHHEAALKYLYRTQGKKYDPIANLCRQVRIKKRYLAFGLIMQAKGKMAAAELARRLGVNKSTISRRWPEVARALKIS